MQAACLRLENRKISLKKKKTHGKHRGSCSWWTGPSQDTNELVAVTQECHQGVSLAFLDIVCLPGKAVVPQVYSHQNHQVSTREIHSFTYRLCDVAGLRDRSWGPRGNKNRLVLMKFRQVVRDSRKRIK